MSQSCNILTWMKLASKEEAAVLVTSLEDHYESRSLLKSKLTKNGTILDIFNVHNAKIVHNLTQYSKWNRKYHPFLLHKCKQGDAVKNIDNHHCKLIFDDDQLTYCNKSKVRFETKYENDNVTSKMQMSIVRGAIMTTLV